MPTPLSIAVSSQQALSILKQKPVFKAQLTLTRVFALSVPRLLSHCSLPEPRILYVSA